MSNPWIVLLICALIFVAVMAGMYFWGRKLQKKQVEQKEQETQNEKGTG